MATFWPFGVAPDLRAPARLVHWDLLDRMTEADIELILQRALEALPGARPQIISDNPSTKLPLQDA